MSENYDAAVLATLQPEPAQAARVGFAGAADTNPDAYAEARRVAQRTGVPVDTVFAMPQEMKRQDQMGSINFDTLAKTSPATAALLADMDRAKLAHDDVENMSGIESALSFLGGSTLAGLNDLAGAGAKLVDSLNPFTLSDQDAAVLYKDQPEKLAQMRAQSPAMALSRFARGRTEASKQNMLDISPGAQATYGDLKYATTDPSNAAYLSPVKLLGDAVRSLPTTAALALTTYLTRGAAIQAEKQALTAGATAEVAREAGIAAATNMAVKFGAASEGSIGYAQQALQTQNDIENMPLDTIGKSPEFLDLVNKGYDPNAARIFLAARGGEQAGVGAGFADAITNAIGGKFLGKIIGEGGGLLPRIGKGFVNEGVVEGVQSPFEQWFQNAATQANADPSKDLSEGLLESTLQGLFVGGLTGGAFAGSMGRAHQKEQQAQQTDQTAQLLTGLNKLAEASKLRERDVETAQGFFQSALAEGRDAVYITPDALAQSGLAEQMAQAIPAVQEQLQTAAESGHDIRIPIADLMATMAGPELEQSLIPHLATEPGGFTPTTAQEYLQSGAAKELQAEVERTLAEQEGNATFKQSAESVKADVKQQLDTAARFTPQVNEAYAAMVGNFYAVQAARTGTTPEEMFKRYPLQIGAQADGQGGFNQDAPAHAGHKITFEVAPNPDNVALTNQWNAIPAEKRLDISTEISQSVVAKALAHYGNAKGDLHMQTGGFEDETNPSVSLWLDKSVAITTAQELTRTIGYALQQKGMMLTSPEKFKGGDEWGAIVVKLGDVADANSAKALYDELRANVRGEDGTALINGHTTDDGHMAILVPKDQAADIAQRVEDHLAGRHEVGTATMHVEWPEKGENDYGYQTEEHSGVGAESPLRAHADQLRTEATRQLEQRIGEAERADAGTGSSQRREPVGGLRVGGRERLRVGNAEVGARYGEPREGTGAVLGIHYSGAPRQNLDGYHYGSGLSGAEAERVAHSDDPRIKQRLHFYVDSGEGIRGEAGTGQHIHGLHLENLYDTSKDPLGLVAQHFKAGDPDWLNGVESALLDAGYAGIVVPKAQGEQGVAVLLGKHTAQPDYLGTHDAQPESGRYVPPPTGKRTYSLMSKEIRQFETDQAAIEAAAPSVKLKEGRLTFDEKDTDAVAQFFPPAKNARLLEQDTGNSARGSFNPDTLSITLLKNADLSTFLHESGHFFLEVQADLAAQLQQDADIHGLDTLKPGERQILTDAQALLDWFGLKSLGEWNNLDFEERRSYHEQFARGFESYLFEGKAPSIELQGLFQRFRAWMLNVYRDLKALNVEITDEVRGVFDRMLATTEQITLAEQGRSMMPLFTSSEQAGMTPDEFAEYQALGTDATNEAIEDLQARGLRDMQWMHNARGRIIKQLQKESAARRAEVQMGVRGEVMSQPVYRAWEYLTGKDKATPDSIIEDTDGNRWSAHGRLDRASLDDMGLPPEVVKLLDALRMVKKDSLHPDIVAELFGFTSGDELVRTLAASDKPADVIEGITDQRMLEQYGDLSSQEAIEKAADKAIHNDVRARMLATELNALAKATGQHKTLASAAKEYAAAMIARLKVRNIKPGQYASAEVRAGKAAEKASKAGELATAAAEKRNQLINTYATRAAYDAQDEVEKGVRYLKKFDSAATRKGLDADYTDQIDAMLERFDLRKAQSGKAIDKRAALAEWLTTQLDAGLEPDIPPALINEAFRKSYKDLTVEEFRGIVDTVKQIEHLGRLKHRLLTSRDQRAYEVVRDEIAASIVQHAQGREANTRTPTTNMGRALQGLKRFWSAHIKAATLARVLDGGKDGGPMWEYFVRSANERGDRETTMRADATAALATIMAPVFKLGKMGGSGQFFPSINRSLNREARIALALNVGNAGNLQRLLGGEGWSLARVMPVLQSLTAQEWRAVQAVWDHFESYRPQIAEKERRIYGKEPDWVAATPFAVTTADGQSVQMRGGYYPIKYDSAASQRAEEHADAEGAKRQLQGAYTTATTRRSFTKGRVEEIQGRPLLYTLSGLYSGVNDVIHDLSWHEWLIDANRLLRSKTIDGAIRNHYGPEAKQQFKTWAGDIAEGEKGADAAVDIALSRLRQGVSAAGLGFNVMSAMMQPLGITQSIVRVGAPYIGRGLMKYIASPIALTRQVNEMSSFMENRARTRFRELNELRNKVQDQTLFKEVIGQGAYFLMMRCQQAVDVPTWWGAYEKAIAQGNDDERAVSLADQSVIDAQGGGQTKDLSAVERGGPAQKLFTVFYSFMNTALNLGIDKTMSADTAAKKAKLAVDYAMLYVIPAVLGYFLKAALTPGDAGDDDPEKLAKKLAANQLDYLMSLMVVVREFSSAAKTAAGIEDFGRAYSGPAGVRVVADAGTLAAQVHQGEFDDAFRKAAINTVGGVFGLPSAQINRTITGVKALADGKTQNPAAIAFGFQEKR